MNVKTCTKCGETKPIESFDRTHRGKEARHSRCKPCRYAEQKESRANGGHVNAARYQAKYRAKNPEETRRIRREANRQLRLRVINAYGGRCVCCGEGTFEFLSIDHTYNDGAAHRKEPGMSGGNTTCFWLQRNGFPKDRFQLLCHNCNLAKAFYGQCPHTIKGSE